MKHSNVRPGPMMLVVSLVIIGGLLFLVYFKADKYIETIKTPPVSDEQLRPLVEKTTAQLRSELQNQQDRNEDFQLSIVTLEEVNSLQNTTIENLKGEVSALRKEIAVVKDLQSQKKEFVPTTLSAKDAAEINHYTGAPEKKHAPSGDPLTPAERAKLNQLKKMSSTPTPDNSSMRRELSNKLRAIEAKREDANKMPAQPLKKLSAKVSKDSSSLNVKRLGKGEYFTAYFA